MDFELCTPFGTELFPHHGDSISQVLSTVVFASKDTYQKQVSHLDDSSPTQFPDFQLFKLRSFFVKFDDYSQFTCKGSKMWTLVKIIGVNKFILLVILDHGEKLVSFPFNRGNWSAT